MRGYDLSVGYDNGEFCIETMSLMVPFLPNLDTVRAFLIADAQDMEDSEECVPDIVVGYSETDAVRRWSFWHTNRYWFQEHRNQLRIRVDGAEDSYYSVLGGKWLDREFLSVEEVDTDDIYFCGVTDSQNENCYTVDELTDFLKAKSSAVSNIKSIPYVHRGEEGELTVTEGLRLTSNTFKAGDFVKRPGLFDEFKGDNTLYRIMGFVHGHTFGSNNPRVSNLFHCLYADTESLYCTVAVCLSLDDDSSSTLRIVRTDELELFDHADFMRWFLNNDCSLESLSSMKVLGLPIDVATVAALSDMTGQLPVLQPTMTSSDIIAIAEEIKKKRSFNNTNWAPPGFSQQAHVDEEKKTARRRTFLNLTEEID